MKILKIEYCWQCYFMRNHSMYTPACKHSGPYRDLPDRGCKIPVWCPLEEAGDE